MLNIKKEYIITDENKKKAVLIDIGTFEKIEEILESYGLSKYMEEVEDEDILSLNDAKSYYKTLKKNEWFLVCLYKKAFLKDLSKLPLDYRKRIEKLVFEEIPKYDSLFKILDIKLMKGHKNYYRIRVGEYRIGCRVEKDSKIIFYRVKSRSDIYQLFP